MDVTVNGLFNFASDKRVFFYHLFLCSSTRKSMEARECLTIKKQQQTQHENVRLTVWIAAAFVLLVLLFDRNNRAALPRQCRRQPADAITGNTKTINDKIKINT